MIGQNQFHNWNVENQNLVRRYVHITLLLTNFRLKRYGFILGFFLLQFIFTPLLVTFCEIDYDGRRVE